MYVCMYVCGDECTNVCMYVQSNLVYPGSVGPGGVRNFEFARNFEVAN